MGIHARIENGFVSIDTAAWLDQRSGGPLEDLTRDLHDWAARHRPAPTPSDGGATEPATGRAWRPVVRAWCTARGHTGPDPRDRWREPLLIWHESTRLDHELWLARARTRDGFAIVVVQVDDETPVVHADAVTDVGDWFDADTVEIGCPNGHGWLWRTGRELVDAATGSFTTLTVVFGADLDAPFTRCRVCDGVDAGRRTAPCGCDGTAWIVCPVCGGRCDVDLPSR